MKSWSSTAGSPRARAVSSAASSALQIPRMAAASPPDAHLEILRADRGRCPGCHLQRLRIAEALKSAFADRVEGDDRNAAPGCVLERVEKTRAVGAGILPEKENAFGLFEVLQNDRADGAADRLRQSDGRALVAHVRAVGKIVAADHAAEQLVHVGGFQRGMAAQIENDRLRIVGAQLPSDLGEGIGQCY